ncbi:MAG: hypothetical protein AAB431_02610 [Patescibacteria group bacterium]
MPFFLIGLLILIFGIYFIRQALKDNDKEGVVGFTAVIIAAIILVIFFGLFFYVLFP